MKRPNGIREVLGWAGLLLLFLWAVAQMRCTPAAVKAEHALVVKDYGLSLDHCRAAARDAGAFAVFEACEREESRKLCAERPQLRTAWVRCAEVMP
jgi:hypothetical protein